MQDMSTYRLADGVTFESVTDGAVVLVFDNGQLYSCNDTSAAFLRALDGQRTLDEVAGIIAGEFDAPVEQILGDLRELAAQMQSEGIIAGAR